MMKSIEIHFPEFGIRYGLDILHRRDTLEQGRNFVHDFIFANKLGGDLITVIIVYIKAYQSVRDNIIGIGGLPLFEQIAIFFQFKIRVGSKNFVQLFLGKQRMIINASQSLARSRIAHSYTIGLIESV